MKIIFVFLFLAFANANGTETSRRRTFFRRRLVNKQAAEPQQEQENAADANNDNPAALVRPERGVLQLPAAAALPVAEVVAAPFPQQLLVQPHLTIAPPGYPGLVHQQHASATAALEDGARGTHATNVLIQSLQNSIRIRDMLQQQLQVSNSQVAELSHLFSQRSSSLATYLLPFSPSSSLFINQHHDHLPLLPQAYSHLVQPQQQSGPQQPGAIRLIDQYGNEVARQMVYGNSAFGQQGGNGNGGGYSGQQQQQQQQAEAPQQQQQRNVPGPQNAYLPPQQQSQQQYHPQYHPQPQLLHHHHPLVHEFIGADGLLYHQQILEQPVYEAPPPPVIQAAPIVKKVVPEIVPSVKLVKQPIIPPAIFQKEIFAVKNPPIRVLTYSDLCTVYPYQRKLSACVYKKAAIPELHHPDIQLVPEQSHKSSMQVAKAISSGQGLLDPRNRNAPLRLSAGEDNQEDENESNIQDILALSRQGLEDEGEDEKVPVVESSNQKELKVTRTNSSRKVKNGSSVIKVVRTPSTTTTEEPDTTTKRPKKKKNKSRRNSNRKSKSSRNKATTEKAFTLAK